MIYLDYAATSPVRREVVETVQETLVTHFGNPSSSYRIGKAAKYQLQQARQRMASLLEVEESSLYFTSGATEANNWAIRSQAEQARQLGKGNHLVVSAIEHPSVLKVVDYLEAAGFAVTRIKPDAAGQITLATYIEATRQTTSGWIAMAVNNEIGSVLPVIELGEAARERGLWFHVDAVQAMGHLGWNFGELPCTSFVGSGHKFYAPKGIGFLVYRPWHAKMTLQPLLHGGGQEHSKRSGTENTPYILGMVKALELVTAEASTTLARHQDLHQYLLAQLEEQAIEFELNGDKENRVPYINSLWIKGLPASQVLIQMDLAEIYISAGSACSAGSLTESQILKAYYPDQTARWSESIRVSFGTETSYADLDQFVLQLKKLIERKR